MNSPTKSIEIVKRIFILFPVLWIAGNISGQEVRTLEQCIDYALEHSILVRQQANQIKKKRIEKSDLKNSYLPDLNLRGLQKADFGRSLNRNNTYEDSNSQSASLSLNTEMPLFTGFRISNSIARANYDLLAAEEGLSVIKNDLSLNITACYFQILLHKEILRIASEQIELTKEQEARTQLLIENGRAPYSQLYEIRAQLADDELTATEARNSLHLSLLELKQLLEWEEETPLDIAPLENENLEWIRHTPQEVFPLSLRYMPQIKQAEYQLESSQRNIKIAQAGYYPILSVGAEISSGYYRLNGTSNFTLSKQLKNNKQKSIYLSLSIPLFDRLSTRNKVRSAKLDNSNAKLTMENEKKALYKEIEKAYTDAMAAREKLNSTSKSVLANEEAHRYAQERYAAGKSTVYEYNESKLKMANALSQQAQAKYRYLLKAKVLIFYTGEGI